MELIVVGFHRSGTSLLTQLLHASGLFVGERLLGAQPSNPYGHFEDMEAMELHQDIMRAAGLDWQVDHQHMFFLDRRHWAAMETIAEKRTVGSRRWGFKDPRVCFFLGQWKHVLPTAKFVMVYRDPAECARSLHARHSAGYLDKSGPAAEHLRFFRQPDHALRMWDAHNRMMLAFARHHLDDCMVIPTTYLHDGYPVVARINQRFGFDLDEVPTSAVFDASATTRRTSPHWVHDQEVYTRVTKTWEELERLTRLTEA